MSFYDLDKNDLQLALPEYRFIRCVGEGAYGKVYLLENKETNELFAVKRISCFGMSEYELAGALNEVRILASLEHPNIVKFYDGLFDKDQDHLYIFLEYANGGDVSQLIEQAKDKRKRVSENTVWKILLNVAQAVQYLHKHDIAHRDIKPANIFKDRLTGFKLGDLNVSKILPQGSMTKTRAGSPFYISPEVWNHEDEGYSFKCDIWSLGIVIYELCCLKVPFEVDSPEEMIQQLKLTRKKSLPRYYSTELHEVVEKMLEIDPKKRITAVAIIQICLKNLKIDTERKGTESVLMKTIVVPETKERWVNLIHFVQRKDKRSISSRKSTEIYSRKSDLPVEMPPLEEDKNLLMVPQMMKRTSRTSKGSRESRESRDVSKSKENDAKLPPLRKYSVDIDYSNLSSLIEKKSDNCSKNSDRPNDLGLRSSRVRRNIVCEYIKEVREDLASLND